MRKAAQDESCCWIASECGLPDVMSTSGADLAPYRGYSFRHWPVKKASCMLCGRVVLEKSCCPPDVRVCSVSHSLTWAQT